MPHMPCTAVLPSPSSVCPLIFFSRMTYSPAVFGSNSNAYSSLKKRKQEVAKWLSKSAFGPQLV